MTPFTLLKLNPAGMATLTKSPKRAPAGTAYHRFILSHQYVEKYNAHGYCTSIIAVKSKLAHRRGKDTWNASSEKQPKSLVGKSKITVWLFHVRQRHGGMCDREKILEWYEWVEEDIISGLRDGIINIGLTNSIPLVLIPRISSHITCPFLILWKLITRFIDSLARRRFENGMVKHLRTFYFQ